MGRGRYHQRIVDRALFEQFLQLTAHERREFVRAAQGTLEYDDVPAAVRTEIERRLQAMGPEPATDYTTLDDFKREVTERRARRTA